MTWLLFFVVGILFEVSQAEPILKEPLKKCHVPTFGSDYLIAFPTNQPDKSLNSSLEIVLISGSSATEILSSSYELSNGATVNLAPNATFSLIVPRTFEVFTIYQNYIGARFYS